MAHIVVQVCVSHSMSKLIDDDERAKSAATCFYVSVFVIPSIDCLYSRLYKGGAHLYVSSSGLKCTGLALTKPMFMTWAGLVSNSKLGFQCAVVQAYMSTCEHP